MPDDKQTKDIKAGLKKGQTYYPSSRIIIGEWPKMATRGNGKGKPQTSKACADQAEYDDYVNNGKTEPLEPLEA
jgi:hypothetical protein